MIGMIIEEENKTTIMHDSNTNCRYCSKIVVRDSATQLFRSLFRSLAPILE
jgi:ABC-type cobalamin/Fe3+-siderophores transport system ATPase subunit